MKSDEPSNENPPYSLWQLSLYFLKLGTAGFGRPIALVGYMFRDLVEKRKWISEEDYKEGLTLAELAPGPLAALGTFLPCYFFTIIPAPYFKKYGKLPFIVSFVNGVTAAAIGAITGAVFVLGKRTVTDISTAILALAAVLILWKIKRMPEPLLILAAALIGLVLKCGAIF